MFNILRLHCLTVSVILLLFQKELYTNETKYRISEANFEPGTEYIATVYNKIIPTAIYYGTKSHGSNEIRWKTPQAGKSVVSVSTRDKNYYVIILLNSNNSLKL